MNIMKILIIGGNQIGRTLVGSLSEQKHDMCIIESEEKIAKEVANKIEALVINGDPTDLAILKDAGFNEKDAVIAVTNDDKTNLFVCEIAKSEKIPKIISVVNNVGNQELFTKLGISTMIPIVDMVVTRVNRSLREEFGVSILSSLGGGALEILEVSVQDKSHLIGQKAEIEGFVIGAIYRKGKLMISKHETVIEEGDVLIVIIESKNVEKILNLVAGK
ncbi:potassium channel family protein [Nanoarchaeota archaeon]